MVPTHSRTKAQKVKQVIRDTNELVQAKTGLIHCVHEPTNCIEHRVVVLVVLQHTYLRFHVQKQLQLCNGLVFINLVFLVLES